MHINKKQKELIKIYIVLFAVIFTFINWGSVSWLFNYRALSGFAHDFLNPQQDSKILAESNVSESSNIQTQAQQAHQKIFYDRPNSLEIPAIGLVTAVVKGRTTDIPSLEKDLDKGVVVYPGSVDPGNDGQTIILGHSAPPGWPKIKHDWVFTDINNLTPGDQIIVYFNNAKYVYRVTSKKIIKKGEDLPVNETPATNVLTLISCWPPGKDQDRITVSAEYEQGVI